MIEKDKNKEIKDISIPYLSDAILEREIKIVLDLMTKSIQMIEKKYESNVIDPFTTLFEKIIFSDDNNDKWKKKEFQRQLQKTLANHIGRFHQNLLCSLQDCKEPDERGTDLICSKKKIFAEIKNKWNSTNADSLAGSYDKLEKALSSNPTFKGYFVTIIPNNSENYCTPLITTKNNKKSQWRKPRKNIMEINAEFFYEKLTNEKNLLKSIYYRIPNIVKNIDSNKKDLLDNIEKDTSFNYFLLKALGNFED